MRSVPHTGRGDGGTEKLRWILPERVFVVGNQKRTVKQHERSRSFSKTGQQGLGKKQRQMENPVLPLEQGRTGFLDFLKEIYKYCIKNMGEFVQNILSKQGKINAFFTPVFYDHIIQKK